MAAPGLPGDDLLDLALLRHLARGGHFADGKQSFAAGQVVHLRAGPDRAFARVNGTRPYRVKLWRSRGELQYSCTCPVGREESFCQHCVAVGLAWLAETSRKHGAVEPDSDSEAGAETAGAGSDPTGATDDGPAAAAAGGGAGPASPARPSAAAEGGSGAGGPEVAPELRAYVVRLEKRRLVDLVLEALEYDEILRRRLLLESIGASGGQPLGAPEVAAYRQVLREAVECPDYVDYDALPDYVQGVEEAIQPLAALLESGQAAVVVELCELALVELDRAVEMIDASDGSLNGIYDELQRLHLEACRQAAPDPLALAARLLHYELEGGLGVFNNALAVYADVLGPRGISAYRRLLQEEWMRLPALRPGDPATPRGAGPGAGPGPKPPAAPAKKPAAAAAPAAAGQAAEPTAWPIDYRRFQLVALMERVAALGRSSRDPDTLAALKARDLSSIQDFLAIARLYRDAGRHATAINWVEDGLRAFPAAAGDDGLRDLLVGLYLDAGRHEDALRLVWAEFTRRPGRGPYQQLRRSAPPADWPRWRRRAFDHLRRAPAAETPNGTAAAGAPPRPPRADETALLGQLLLEEPDAEAAFAEAESSRPHLPPEVWLELARRREKSHPEQALRIYRAQFERYLDQTEPKPLPRAAVAGLWHQIQGLYRRLGRPGECETYRAELRQAYRGRRGLARLLEPADGDPPAR